MAEQTQQHANLSSNGAAALKGLDKSLTDSLWTVHNLQLSVENFAGNHSVIEQRLNHLVQGMRHLDGIGEELRDVKVPVDLLRYIDVGGSPDVFTAETIKHAVEQNQRSKGKVTAFRELQRALQEQAQQVFPEDTNAYLGAVDRAGTVGVTSTSQAAEAKP
eukprot:CAMPEP_0117653080 /NCGR_PEP_ID=MMETSP0804-20121206/2995_1 /TAXON_ID=1074897 /ORGANISM="Tetraselmis astigmatica, Strain CCMP880" /LENGTH=160 /DNA_ID=CAMNT_0005459221 /DNA_START=182 /DNA_END=661 /DNA_ORIENTATION=+